MLDKILRPQGMNALDKEIEHLVEQLGGIDPTDKNYAIVADNLRTLCEARERKNDRTISAEMLLGVIANVAGLLIVLNFEKTGVITSKAFSMLWRKS